MLELVDIKKDYVIAGGAVHALKGVSIKFRKNEFVSILGASGCGKTTLLNIIGGLDNYTSGDLIIAGTSTKDYKDGDWDTYRNHSIGFIFQSYHLIPHQTILQNVELALTISGVSKKERRKRAKEALKMVGLGDKFRTRPNQLSGGQAQRVAIARALINNPEIVLADEPTGALDSTTSVQIMELLKEVSKERLVIMVTHNPELAEQYSTRIIRLKDGEVVDDTMPYEGEPQPVEDAQTQDITGAIVEGTPEEQPVQSEIKGKKKKDEAAMSAWMAFSLSAKNLMSKFKRTALVSFAGSIGIIGVSMVLAISAGVQNYIADMENDMLSGYPLSITRSSYDFTSLMQISQENMHKVDLEELAKGNKVYINSLLDTLGTFSTGFEKTNNISEAYIDYVSNMDKDYVNLIQYDYAFNIVNNLYTDFTVSNNLSSHLPQGAEITFEGGNTSVAAIMAMYAAVLSKVEEYKAWGSMISSVQTFAEMPNNYDYVMSQYDVLAIDKDGNAVTEGYTEDEVKQIFNDKSTLFMVVDNYKIEDLTLAQYGYFTEYEFLDYAFKGIDPDKEITLVGEEGFPYSYFTSKKFTYYTNDSVYTKAEYKAKPEVSDEQIIAMFGLMGDDGTMAGRIIDARNTSDEELLNVLRFMGNGNQNFDIQKYYEMFKLPPEDKKTEGYVANAYSTEYTFYDDGTPITLPAFDTKPSYEDRVEMNVKLILQKKESVSYGCLNSGFYYTNALTEHILKTEAESEIVKYIEENGALKEVPMYVDYYYVYTDETDGKQYYKLATTENTGIETGESNVMASIIGAVSGSESEGVTAAMLGGSTLPTAIYIYAKDFKTKNKITKYLDDWNKLCEKEEGASYTYTVKDEDGEEHEYTVTLQEKDKITYADTVGLIISMVNTMIQMITIALVCFTALSLVVSTVMVGIITYVSVVERTKEIGILRSVGARKKDIKRLFNAETFIIGLAAGLVGIGVTYLLSLLVNVIVGAIAGVYTIAALPIWQAIIMILISVGLTLISGLIPASAAAKKDPVVALRTQ